MLRLIKQQEKQQEDQGLQAFAFSVVTGNDEHWKPRNSGLKATGIFVILLNNILNTSLQKESPKQSLPKVTSEVAVRKYSSLRPATLFKRDFNRRFFVGIAKFLRKAFFMKHLGWYLSIFSS